jgi:hypothetical protein
MARALRTQGQFFFGSLTPASRANFGGAFV